MDHLNLEVKAEQFRLGCLHGQHQITVVGQDTRALVQQTREISLSKLETAAAFAVIQTWPFQAACWTASAKQKKRSSAAPAQGILDFKCSGFERKLPESVWGNICVKGWVAQERHETPLLCEQSRIYFAIDKL